MIAADTNVALRLVLEDDEAQLASIAIVMAEQPLFLPLTVLLEVGWVLASRYQMKRHDLATALAALLALDGIEVARAKWVDWAIERFRAGADWADVIHLVASQKLAGFATFDRGLAYQAADESPVPITTLR